MAEPTVQPIAASPNTTSRKPKRHKEKSQQQQRQQPSGTPLHNEVTGPVSAAAAAGRKDKDSSDGVLALADYDVEFGDFDYDAVKAEEGAELWLVRAPPSVRFCSSSFLPPSRFFSFFSLPSYRQTPRACAKEPTPLSSA